jgi:hypothetical protein
MNAVSVLLMYIEPSLLVLPLIMKRVIWDDLAMCRVLWVSLLVLSLFQRENYHLLSPEPTAVADEQRDKCTYDRERKEIIKIRLRPRRALVPWQTTLIPALRTAK